MKVLAMAAAAAVTIGLAACGGSSTPQSTGAAVPKATVTAAPTTTQRPPVPKAAVVPKVTAYDDALLTQVEGEIRKQMRAVVQNEPNATQRGPIVSHCIADSDRNFTCDSFSEVEMAGLCVTIKATQRGNVSPNGDYTWKNTDTSSNDPAPCGSS